MPAQGYVWLDSMLKSIIQKCMGRRGCNEVGLGVTSLRQ